MHSNTQSSTLVGRTLVLSKKNNRDGGFDTQRVTVLSESVEDGVRYYKVQDLGTKKKFDALASTYDSLFLTKRQSFRKTMPKGDGVYHTQNVNYNLKK